MSRLPFQALLLVAGLATAAALSGPARPVRAQERVDDFRAKVEKWVETRQITSQEKTQWEVEKQTLQSTRKLLQQEKESLTQEIEELEQSNTQADEERRDLLLKRADLLQASRALEDRIRALEEEVLSLAPRLPVPLQEKLELLLVQIPEDPEEADVQLGQRLMNVLGVLAQAEKFNSTATFVGETRSVNGDQTRVQVRTLYWGLGQAVYVDARGESAGIGRPGANGWEFSEEREIAGQAKLLLDIYEGNVDTIEFVELPVEIR